MLSLRRTDVVLRHGAREGLTAWAEGDVLHVERRAHGEARRLVLNLGTRPATVDLPGARLLLASAGGVAPGAPLPPGAAMVLAAPPRAADRASDPRRSPPTQEHGPRDPA
jgi:hypothetical protein